MDLHGADIEDFYAQEGSEQRMKDVFYDVAANAWVHLEAARKLQDDVCRELSF
eukprot:SAG11_NODE_25321_length_360_cov_0.973180_1_plen_52_part_01